VRFLVDESVSPTISQVLIASGHDSVSVRDVLGTGADDLVVLRAAVENDRVIITQDRDFGTLLHAPGTLRASVVL
jgi:predicted nuclease of predicted toxin-antitoxin system